MPTIRFAVRAPTSPELDLPSVPATFSRRVWDIDDSTSEGAARAGRMRWAGQPFGVIELGPIDAGVST